MCLRFWRWCCCCCCQDLGYRRMDSQVHDSSTPFATAKDSFTIARSSQTSTYQAEQSSSAGNMMGDDAGSSEESDSGSYEDSNDSINNCQANREDDCSDPKYSTDRRAMHRHNNVDVNMAYVSYLDGESSVSSCSLKESAQKVHSRTAVRSNRGDHTKSTVRSKARPQKLTLNTGLRSIHSRLKAGTKSTARKQQSIIRVRSSHSHRKVLQNRSNHKTKDHDDLNVWGPLPQSHGDLTVNQNGDMDKEVERIKDGRGALDRGEEIRMGNDPLAHDLSILDQFTRKDSDIFSHDSYGRPREKQMYTLTEHNAYTLSRRHSPCHVLQPITSSSSDDSLNGYGVPCDAAYSCVMTSKPESTAAVTGAADAYHVTNKIDCWYDELTYGNIYFTASYFNSTKKLFVHVKNLEGLPVKTENFAYDVILKICILPKESGNRTKISHIYKRNLNPDIDEDFTFYVRDINVKTMKISVYDINCQDVLNAVGHTLVYLGDMQHEKDNNYACKLYRQSTSDICQGHIQLTTKLNKQNDNLEVVVKRAKGLLVLLTQMTARNDDTPEILDFESTYVTVALHCGEDMIKTRKSRDVQDMCNPEYNTSFTFNLKKTKNPFENFVVVTVKKKTLIRECDIGRVVIGPFYYATSNGRQVLTPWGITLTKDEVVSTWYRMYS